MTPAGRRRSAKSIPELECGPTTSTICSRSSSGDEAEAAGAEDLAGGVPAGDAHDASARMGGGAAEVQALDGSAVPRVAGDGPEREELGRSHRALENIAAREIEDALEIERGQHLTRQHRAAKVRRVLVEQVDAPIGKALAQLVPIRLPQRVGRVLDEDRHEMLARRRYRRIHH